MALASAYQSFLASQNPALLAKDASLHYITTLTSFSDAATVVTHLATQQKIEKLLSTIEGHNALCMEVETTIEFISGGGAYLPGLDDNFLADRVVTFPVVCTNVSTTHIPASLTSLGPYREL